jgi:hypothetical protein
LEALLENYFKLSIIFLRNLLEKNLKSKYYFLAFNQPYASLLAKVCLKKICFIQYGLLFQTIIECVSQSLFYKLLFYYLERIEFKLYFYYFMQAKPLGSIKIFY